MESREAILRYQRSLDCVHCGLCLPVCPTYRLTGKESASPRGRIYLMRAFAERRLTETAESIREIDRCLVCRACEPVCPSGVQFGEMMELTRDLVEETPARGAAERRWKRLLFRWALPRAARVRLLANLLSLYQKTGLRSVLQRVGLLRLLGRSTALRDGMLPPIPPIASRREPPLVTRPEGKTRARVGFLVGCVAHELLPDANRAAISVLRRNGCEVWCPRERPCCGALPLHFGDLEAARSLARATVDCFPDNLDAIVVSSAGCAAAMKEYGRLLESDGDTPLARRARTFASRVKDFSEFLVDLPWEPPPGELHRRVAFDDPCHLLHAQRIDEAPRRLIAAVPGVELVSFAGQENCCGAAGLASVTSPQQSLDLLRQKMQHVAEAAPELLVTANPGCQLQLRSGARRWLPEVEVLHLAELLERAYREGVTAGP